MRTLKIASIPGDGIGKEVVPAAEEVVQAAVKASGGVEIEFTQFPWSCEIT